MHLKCCKLSKNQINYKKNESKVGITMKISQIQQIVEIISCGSINKAAQKLYISQSGLCASLNAVEKELGQQILHRSYSGITLTPFGIKFVEAAHQILEIYDQLRLNALPEEHDRLCISSEFLLYASSAFTIICAENGKENTEYRFTEKSNDEILQDVFSGRSDLGLIVTPTASRDRVFAVLEKMELEGTLICTNECSCLVGPHSPLYELEIDSIPLEHLSLYPRLKYERKEWPTDKDIFLIQDTTFPCNGCMIISDAGSYHNFLARTNCYFVGVYNQHAYKKVNYYDNIRALRLSNTDFSWDTIWLRRKGWGLTPLEKKYLQLLYDLSGMEPDKTIL